MELLRRMFNTLSVGVFFNDCSKQKVFLQEYRGSVQLIIEI